MKVPCLFINEERTRKHGVLIPFRFLAPFVQAVGKADVPIAPKGQARGLTARVAAVEDVVIGFASRVSLGVAWKNQLGPVAQVSYFFPKTGLRTGSQQLSTRMLPTIRFRPPGMTLSVPRLYTSEAGRLTPMLTILLIPLL